MSQEDSRRTTVLGEIGLEFISASWIFDAGEIYD